jgi:hypothetical protein
MTLAKQSSGNTQNEITVASKITNRLLLLILTAGVSACVTVSGISDEVALTEAGATRLDAAQVKAHVIGKTEQWDRGGAYYMADGELRVVWAKVFSDGSWEVSDDGTLCYQVPRWQERCHIYMNHEDMILTLEDDRNIGTRQLLEGNKLSVLKRGNSDLNRRK